MCDERTLEQVGLGRDRRRCTCSGGEHVDSFEDEEAGESAAEIRYAGALLAKSFVEGSKNVRSEQRHVGTADERVRDLCVESADCDEHDRVHERREHMFGDDNEEETTSCATGGEDGDNELRESCCRQTANEGVAPNVHGWIRLTPFTNVVAEEHLNREVNQDNKGKLLLLKALIEELQAGDGIIGLESDLGDQVDDDERLDVLELQDAPHGRVDFLDAIGVAVAVLALHNRQPECDSEVCPAPECEVAIELQETGLSLCAGTAEPLVREVF